MATRSKTKWTLDSQGQYPRQIGWKQDGDGKFVQHKFRLGNDRKEAERREGRLQELWQHIESTNTSAHRPVWNDLTLRIAKQIARGEIQIAIERGTNSPEVYARYLHRLQRAYPMVSIVAEDEAAYVEGAATNQQTVQQKLDEVTTAHLHNGNMTNETIAAGGPTLHQALTAYADHIRRTKVEVAVPQDFAFTRLRNVERLKERHKDVLLSVVGLDAIQDMIDYWRGRPAVKRRGTPCTSRTVRHHTQELLRFFKWVHRSDRFPWRKPADFADLETNVEETAAEVQARASSTQVKAYSVDQLRLLYEYATPLERLVMLLAVNCGFGAAESGTLTADQVFLHQSHPHADELGYVTQPDDSFIRRIRLKKVVYGEHLLWPHTVQALEWAVARRREAGSVGPDTLLLVTDRGQPCLKRTKSGHEGQWFANKWGGLTKRVQKDHPDFPKLSFGKLRKTGGNMIRLAAGGEAAGVFLCHGRPVKSDHLAEVYTNRVFGRVFQAIKDVQQKLAPVFAAVPEPFGVYHQMYTSRTTAKKIIELHLQGWSIRQIADEVKKSKTTVQRHVHWHNGTNPDGGERRSEGK